MAPRRERGTAERRDRPAFRVRPAASDDADAHSPPLPHAVDDDDEGGRTAALGRRRQTGGGRRRPRDEEEEEEADDEEAGGEGDGRRGRQ